MILSSSWKFYGIETASKKKSHKDDWLARDG